MTPEMADSVRRRRQTAKAIKVKMVERTRGRRGFQKKWQLLIAIALTVGSFLFYHHLPSSSSDPLDFSSLTEEEKEELRELEPAIIRNLTAGGQHEIGRFCDSNDDCFTVLQRYWWKKEYGLTGQRIIQYELADSMALTMSFLITPEIVTAHYLDHERWRVDHARPVWSYNLMQIAAGFMLEGLSFGRNSSQPLQQQRVLQIGMGGGSATGFLSEMPLDLHIDVVELEPAVYEAAKRWFDFPQSPNIKVHIMDGVVFLREAAEAGLTFDSLILDTSVNSANATQICPHPVFMQEQVMRDMSKVIGPTGVLSVNVFMSSDQLSKQEEVAAKFSVHFRSCSALTITTYGQKFLACTNRDGFDWTRQRKRMLANLEEFDDVIGTRIAPSIDKLNHLNSDLE